MTFEENNIFIDELTASSIYKDVGNIIIDPLPYIGNNKQLYLPPEKFSCQYISESRLIEWSFGIILYYIYHLKLPFKTISDIIKYSINKEELYKGIKKNEIMEIIQSLLNNPCHKRISVKELYKKYIN